MRVKLISYDKRLSREHFDSGRPVLDQWLKLNASQQESMDNCRTVLAIDEDTGLTIGYFTLLNYLLKADEVALAFGVENGRYPKPAVLLARLAVHRPYQGRGVGTLMLEGAFERAAAVADLSGCELLVVDAIDVEAAAYYLMNDFRAFRSNPLRLYVAMKDVRRTLHNGRS